MAEESERLSKTLLDSISHEIRTPIAVITTAAGTLNAARDPSLTQVPWAMIDEIQEATRRLNRLVGNPLNMTRLQRDWRTKPSNLASNQTGPERCATALLGETEVQYAKCADYETGKSQSILEKTYGDAVVSDEPQIQELVALYAMISRMRVLSFPRTVACAEKIVNATLDTYFAPNKTIRELHELMKSGGAVIDPLRDFSEAAREELRAGP